MDNTLQLETMKTRIESMEKEHHVKILKLLHSDPNVKINENKSGCYVNLSFLPREITEKVQSYLDYVRDQENMLHMAESEKETYVKTFFEEDAPQSSHLNSGLSTGV